MKDSRKRAGVGAGAVRRSSPTGDELRVWRDFVETGDRLRSLLAARLLAESGLSTGDYSVLLALSEAPGKRMRSSELATAIDWERSRLSHHLGRMERRGLIARSPSASDSRGADVALTEVGASRFRRASVAHLRAVQDLFVDAFVGEGTRASLGDVQTITDSIRRAIDPPGE